MCQDILDFRFRDIVIVDVRNAGRGINVVSNLHVVIMRPFSATSNAPMSGAEVRSTEASAPLAG